MTRIMSCPGVVMTTSEATMNSNQEASSMVNHVMCEDFTRARR